MRDYHLPGRSPVYATHGMAATSMPAATLTALDVLRAGGNALDAAVAACAVLCVIEPQSTGIGGDCFCLYAPAGAGKVIALNGSGRAPAAATIDWYEQHGIAAIENTSAHAVTVPGAINAWETLLKAHGRKGLDELLQPAIRFAADGWPVHPEGGVGLEAARGEAAQERRARVPAERRGAERRRHLPQSGAGRDAARHRPPRRQGVLRGCRSPPTSSRPCARAAACTPRRISPPASPTPSSSSRSR